MCAELLLRYHSELYYVKFPSGEGRAQVVSGFENRYIWIDSPSILGLLVAHIPILIPEEYAKITTIETVFTFIQCKLQYISGKAP